MSLIQKFLFSDDSTIDGSWTKLKEYRRKVISANRNYASTYPDEVLFQTLNSVLFKADKYSNVLDGFLTQNLTVDESLKILQGKESQTREVEVSIDDRGLNTLQQRRQNCGR